MAIAEGVNVTRRQTKWLRRNTCVARLHQSSNYSEIIASSHLYTADSQMCSDEINTNSSHMHCSEC